MNAPCSSRFETTTSKTQIALQIAQFPAQLAKKCPELHHPQHRDSVPFETPYRESAADAAAALLRETRCARLLGTGRSDVHQNLTKFASQPVQTILVWQD